MSFLNTFYCGNADLIIAIYDAYGDDGTLDDLGNPDVVRKRADFSGSLFSEDFNFLIKAVNEVEGSSLPESFTDSCGKLVVGSHDESEAESGMYSMRSDFVRVFSAASVDKVGLISNRFMSFLHRYYRDEDLNCLTQQLEEAKSSSFISRLFGGVRKLEKKIEELNEPMDESAFYDWSGPIKDLIAVCGEASESNSEVLYYWSL